MYVFIQNEFLRYYTHSISILKKISGHILFLPAVHVQQGSLCIQQILITNRDHRDLGALFNLPLIPYLILFVDMVFVPINLSTAIICGRKGEDFNSFSLLFKVAYKFAQKGLIVYVLSKFQTHLPPIIGRDLLQANVLERIHFRYFSSSEEVIKWCHEAHYIRKKPTVLLVSIKDFIQSDNVESLGLCAALIDVMIYFTKVLTTKQLYLLGVLIIDFNSFIPHLLTFFNVSWLATMNHHSLQLSPFQTDGRSAFSIRLDHDTAFEDIQKIFLNEVQ